MDFFFCSKHTTEVAVSEVVEVEVTTMMNMVDLEVVVWVVTQLRCVECYICGK
jgi:hypothetical protein